MSNPYTIRLAAGQAGAIVTPIVLYAAPAGVTIVVRDVIVLANTANAITNLAVRTGGHDIPILYYTLAVAATQHLDCRQVLEAGDQLVLSTTAASVLWLVTGYSLSIG